MIADDISYYESLYNRNFAHKAESMTVQNLRDALFAYKNREGIGIDFYSFAEEHIRQMRENGQKGSASVYVSAVNCLKDFKPELSIQELRSDLLKEFENYMRRPRTITRNNGHSNITYHKEPMINSGVLSYMSRLRALFNAAKEKYNDDNNDITIIKHEPFVRYKMPVANMATKRSISEKEIARIINYEPNKDDTQLLKQARDVFMMMIYLSGINSIDLYYATPAIDGRINYNRHKTKRKRRDNAPMSIQIQPELQPLLEKYSDPANKYLLNFYKKYSDEKNFLRAIDKGLKSLGEKLNLSQKLTTYTARHSIFLFLLKNK